MQTQTIPLQAASDLSGVPTNIIKEWARQFRAIRPNMGHGKSRFNEVDIERLRLLKAAVDKGYPIGDIAGLGNETLAALIREQKSILPFLEAHQDYFKKYIDRFLGYIELFDGLSADRIIAQQSILFRPREFVHGMISPLMAEIGHRWEVGRMMVAQEHLASNILRNLLGSIMRVHTKSGSNLGDESRIIFATPPGQHHEFGILAAAILSCSGGLGSIYLGANVPYRDLLEIPKRTKVSGIVMSLIPTESTPSDWLIKLVEFRQRLPQNIPLVVGGRLHPAERETMHEEGITCLHSLVDLDQFLLLQGARF